MLRDNVSSKSVYHLFVSAYVILKRARKTRVNGRKVVRHTPFAVDRSQNVSQCYHVWDSACTFFFFFTRFFFLTPRHIHSFRSKQCTCVSLIDLISKRRATAIKLWRRGKLDESMIKFEMSILHTVGIELV